jgi:hypothetical protein
MRRFWTPIPRHYSPQSAFFTILKKSKFKINEREISTLSFSSTWNSAIPLFRTLFQAVFSLHLFTNNVMNTVACSMAKRHEDPILAFLLYEVAMT